ncbi:hypothetical protein HDU97_010133 [Phlyctochytrium planicorne]|nr:hypothetical protein HDU97_010133 [Phlyctochytrium planicorne]
MNKMKEGAHVDIHPSTSSPPPAPPSVAAAAAPSWTEKGKQRMDMPLPRHGGPIDTTEIHQTDALKQALALSKLPDQGPSAGSSSLAAVPVDQQRLHFDHMFKFQERVQRLLVEIGVPPAAEGEAPETLSVPVGSHYSKQEHLTFDDFVSMHQPKAIHVPNDGEEDAEQHDYDEIDASHFFDLGEEPGDDPAYDYVDEFGNPIAEPYFKTLDETEEQVASVHRHMVMSGMNLPLNTADFIDDTGKFHQERYKIAIRRAHVSKFRNQVEEMLANLILHAPHTQKDVHTEPVHDPNFEAFSKLLNGMAGRDFKVDEADLTVYDQETVLRASDFSRDLFKETVGNILSEPPVKSYKIVEDALKALECRMAIAGITEDDKKDFNEISRKNGDEVLQMYREQRKAEREESQDQPEDREE